ncbi:MAG: hypothetical protein P8M30_00880 [Planctomycetaceae bacterium]|nr:hypothetical protein [Planctomycetaceae bacterium]
MGRKNNNSGSGWLIGLIVVGFFLYANPGIAILLAVGGVAIYFFFAWDSTGKSKTVKHSKTFFGNRKRTTEYHDTGKVVEQVSSPTWTGGTKRETKVVRPGQRTSTPNGGGGIVVELARKHAENAVRPCRVSKVAMLVHAEIVGDARDCLAFSWYRRITKECTGVAKPGVLKWRITCRDPVILDVRCCTSSFLLTPRKLL